jgi:RHS repeat-associated protein
LYQIIQATHPSIPNPLEQFTYDTTGNRLTDLTHTNYQYNELNQLIEDDSCMYTYDADGNMTTKTSRNTGDTTHFVWDIENKLTEVRKPGMIAKYTYDALGRRMSKTVNGETKKFGYDGVNLILEMNETDSIVADYTHGPGVDNPLMMNRAGKNYYYAKDGLGSVTALTDSTGSVIHEYKYSVFGKIVEETGDSAENPFTYTSREYDKETGNYFYRARYYNPDLGRFISEDPIGFRSGDNNFYRYVQNSGINFRDPLGKCVEASGSDPDEVKKRYPELLRRMSPEARKRIAVLEQSKNNYEISFEPSIDMENGNWNVGALYPSKNGAEIWVDPDVPGSLAHELGGHGYQWEGSSQVTNPQEWEQRYQSNDEIRVSREKEAFKIANWQWDQAIERAYRELY